MAAKKKAAKRKLATAIFDSPRHYPWRLKRRPAKSATPPPSVAPYPKPSARSLKVYAFDPSFDRALNNHLTIQAPYEKLAPGPIGRKIAVVDYDASNKVWYEPVDLEARFVLLNDGLDPSEGDPRFHQQMVYAVASRTIRRFEYALGREIHWHKDNGRRTPLRILPHAFQQANAYYDPGMKALLFGYFSADSEEPGSNLPGQTVFTCLSHDIVAHETTHAVLDTIRQPFTESTSTDTMAFHEAFADIVALFQHFSMPSAVLDTIERTGGLLYRPVLSGDADALGAPIIGAEMTRNNPLVGLARQFGEALGTRAALREAIGTKADPRLMQTLTEPHDRGAILVAALFDAYFSIYVKRTRDLMRLGRLAGNDRRDLHPDLAKRLSREAAKTAEHILNICIRAVDYCPPVDLQFGEYLRAMITADYDLVPQDPYGYRAELINAFRRRGIVPEDVTSYSEDALRWHSARGRNGKKLPPCTGLNFDLLRTRDKVTSRGRQGWKPDMAADKANKTRQDRNHQILRAYARRHADALGMARKTAVRVESYHPVFRFAPDGRLMVEFSATFLENRKIRLDPDDPKSPLIDFQGGATVVFDHRGEVRYAIYKRIDSTKRQNFQREHLLGLAGNYLGLTGSSFAAIHRGY